MIFITGARLAVPRGSAIRGVADLAGRRVAVVGGTTHEAAMRDVDRLRALRLTFVVTTDHRDALALLVAGKADALGADEVLLRGVLAETGSARNFRIVGPMFSFEPYGIMVPRGEAAFVRALRIAAGLEDARTARASAVEARWQFHGRWSLVSFGGAGKTWTRNEGCSLTRHAGSGGMGFRCELANKFGLHAGIGGAMSPGTTAAYVVIGNAWFRP